MAVLKKDTILFSKGRQITIPGGILSITRNLELADYYSRNILFYDAHAGPDKKESVVNIYHLTAEELIEIADLMIRLWIDLKDNVRAFGINNPEIFKGKKTDK